jgi:hypothetical protein
MLRLAAMAIRQALVGDTSSTPVCRCVLGVAPFGCNCPLMERAHADTDFYVELILSRSEEFCF